MREWQFVSSLLSLLLLLSCADTGNGSSTPASRPLGDGLYAILTTKHGETILRLDHQRAPLTVANFVGLAEGLIPNQVKGEGEPYFDGLTFHRVEPGFVIQGGDPLANGLGGPGYQFRQEIHPELTHNVPGTLAMANAGPNTNGSQFYITHQPTPALDGGYNVFGYVAKGMEHVYQVQRGDTIQSIRIQRIGEAAEQFDAKATFDSLRGAAAPAPVPPANDVLPE